MTTYGKDLHLSRYLFWCPFPPIDIHIPPLVNPAKMKGQRSELRTTTKVIEHMHVYLNFFNCEIHVQNEIDDQRSAKVGLKEKRRRHTD